MAKERRQKEKKQPGKGAKTPGKKQPGKPLKETTREVPSTPTHKSQSWKSWKTEKKCVSNKRGRSERQREKWCDEKLKKEEEQKGKVLGNEVAEEVQRVVSSLLWKNAENNKVEKARKRRSWQPKVRWTLGILENGSSCA